MPLLLLIQRKIASMFCFMHVYATYFKIKSENFFIVNNFGWIFYISFKGCVFIPRFSELHLLLVNAEEARTSQSRWRRAISFTDEVRSPLRAKLFLSVLPRAHNCSEVHPTSYPVPIWCLLSWSTAAGASVWNSPSPITEAKKDGAISPRPSTFP